MKTKLYPYIKALQPVLFRIYFPVVVFLFVVLLINILGDIPFSRLTRDPMSIAGLNPLFGIVSNVGILLWCAATAICFFSATLLNNWKDREHSRFLFVSGLLTSFLLVDDFFVIHESLRDYFGFSEKAFYALYVLLLGSYLVTFRKLIFNKFAALFILAFGFLGSSLMIDIFQKLIESGIPGYFFLEDGLKLIGITSWAGYFAYTAFTHIAQQDARQTRENDGER